MRNLITKLKHFWRAPAALPPPREPYEVTCVCGQHVQGTRQETFQRVRCAHCRREAFILPQNVFPPSPQPSPLGGEGRGPAAPAGPSWRVRLRPWRTPLAALCLLAVILVGVLVLGSILGKKEPSESTDSSEAVTRERVLGQMEAGRKLMAQGNFRLALVELASARQEVLAQPRLLTADQLRKLQQLYRQADLLADLLSESLEEIVRHAAGVLDREWEKDFTHRYGGKAVVFDTAFRQREDGQWEMTYRVSLEAEEVQLEVGQLKMWERLPLKEGQRIIFGARLDSIARVEAKRGWAIRFHADSGVLFSELEAIAVCCPALRDDASRAVLERQANWLVREPLSLPTQKKWAWFKRG